MLLLKERKRILTGPIALDRPMFKNPKRCWKTFGNIVLRDSENVETTEEPGSGMKHISLTSILQVISTDDIAIGIRDQVD